MTLLKSIIITGSLILSSALALAQVDGSIGRPGDPPGSIGRPDDRYPPPDNNYPPDRNPPGRYPPGRDPYRDRQSIHCGSSGYRYNTCLVGGQIVAANVMRVHSHSACTEGYSWGYTRDYIWVDHGCEATFDVVTRGGGRPHPGPGPRPGPGPGPRPRPPHGGEEQVIYCDSSGYNFNQCFVGGGYGDIIDVQLLEQRSRSSCDYGYSWGFDYQSVWVDRGCKGTFRVVKGYRR